MKKAQVQTQIFIYIVAIVVVGMILIFGFRAVKNLGGKAEEVAKIKFGTELQSKFKTVRADYGSIEKIKFLVPQGYREVCFISDSLLATPQEVRDETGKLYTIITDSVVSKVKKNTFLVKDVAEESYYLGSIKIQDNRKHLCVPVNVGELKLRLEGKGSHVQVGEWS